MLMERLIIVTALLVVRWYLGDHPDVRRRRPDAPPEVAKFYYFARDLPARWNARAATSPGAGLIYM
jgi:hypothetical protein